MSTGPAVLIRRAPGGRRVDVRGLEFTAPGPGDHAYRTGAFRWALAEGVWGLIRVRDTA